MRGQIAIDAVLAFLLLILVSLYLSYTIFFNTSQELVGLKSDRLSDVLDNLEDSALLAYSNNEVIYFKMPKIGTINYNILIGNREYNVINNSIIKLTPYKDGIKIDDNPTNYTDTIVITYNTLTLSKKVNIKFYY